MTSVGYATLQIIPSMEGVAKSIVKQGNGEFAAAGKAGGKTMGQGFLSGFTGLAARITGAIAIGQTVKAAFNFGKSAVIDFNSQLEQSKIAFTTMLGSAQKANTFLTQLQKFANSTPFEFPDLVQSSQELLAMGVNAKSVIPTLTAIGDAAAGLGGGQETIAALTRAIGQMTAKGKVQSDEILQLTEAGVPALAILADKFGVSTSKMQDMITAGKVLAKDAVPALVAGLEQGTKSTAGFGGMMAKQSKTFKGALSTIKDSVTQTIGNVTLPLFQRMSSGLQSVAAAVQSPAFAAFGKKLSSAFGSGLSKAGDIIGKLRDGLAGFDWSPVITGFRNLGTAAGSLVSLGKSLWSIFGPLILPAIKELGPAFGLAAGWVKDLAGWLASAGKWLSQYSGWIRPIAVGIAAIVAWQKLWAIQTLIVTGVTKAWAAAQVILDAAMDANPIGIVVLAVVALVAAFIYAWKNSETFRTVVLSVLNAIKVAALAVVGFFTGPFVNFFKAIGAWFAGPFVGFFVGAWNAIKGAGVGAWNGIKGAWNAVAGFFGGVGRAIAGAFSSAWGAVKSGFNSVKNTLKSAVDTVVGFFTSIPGRIAGIGRIIGQDIMNGVRSLWNSTLGGKGITIPIINKSITIPRLAHGGIADKPTLALIGEAGPEAVVPLAGSNGRRAARGMGLDRPGGGALVENLTVNVGQGANVRDGLEEVNFQLRRISRGGLYA